MFSRPISFSRRMPFDNPRRCPLKTTEETFRPSTCAISALLCVRYSRLRMEISSFVQRGRTLDRFEGFLLFRREEWLDFRISTSSIGTCSQPNADCAAGMLQFRRRCLPEGNQPMIDVRFPPNLLVGTSSWSTRDWCGSFYPESIEPGDMIRSYARQLRTVEIDATWHHMPSRNMVEAWKSRTPTGFVFSAKVPKIISHEKYLEDCEAELTEFLTIMSPLEEKLGPLVLQFPYVAKGKDPGEYETGDEFIARLRKFVGLLPAEFKWGVEIRNTRWLGPALLDILRARGISLVFIDYYTMDPLPKLARHPEVFTAPFVYIRFLGNHKEMDAAVREARDKGTRRSDWESLLQDRTAEMKQWIPPIKALVAKDIPTYVYFNNHYAGYAPGSVELFSRLYETEG